ncbi:hypothetical protein QE250_02385 [Chromatiaceae bacterium AAb-1]|nr:hypothetical protein [Chromatiaceae bacterium AAb-1]
MEPVENKDINTQQQGRRRFLMRAGLGSLPVLLTLKSKAAWGTSTLNCSLSTTASQMQSVAPDTFNTCRGSFRSHGPAHHYFDKDSRKKHGHDRRGYFYNKHAGKHQKTQHLTDEVKHWRGIAVHQDTRFTEIFGSGYSSTLANALAQHGLVADITACFLHSLYFQLEGVSSNLPGPDAFVNAYVNSVTSEQKQNLAGLLELYIHGA